MTQFFWGVYLITSIIWSGLLAFCAQKIHAGGQSWKEVCDLEILPGTCPTCKRDTGGEIIYHINWPKRINGWILNFLGSVMGWIALAYLIKYRFVLPQEIGWQDVLILLIGFYGITGYLPHFLINRLGALK